MNELTSNVSLVPIAGTGPIHELVAMALATYRSKHTRRMYATYLRRFLESHTQLTREGVALYLQVLRDKGAKTGTLIGVKSAIKKLAKEAELRRLISYTAYHQIASLSAGKYDRNSKGLWLTIEQVERLLAAPDRATYTGQRDACILSLMVGCGLRKEEMSNLTWDNYQEREGRMCLVNLVGKGDKTRTLPVPLWCQADVDCWHILSQTAPPPPVTNTQKAHAANSAKHPLDPNRVCHRIGYSKIDTVVTKYGKAIGVSLSPHDLRRTLAKMLHRGGAGLEQIQHTLGHQHIQTTMLYIGSTLELAPGAAAVDRLPIGPAAGGVK